MVNMKGYFMRIPSFALETVDAPEGKLIAKPRSVAFVRAVSAGSMFPKMWFVRINESLHQCPLSLLAEPDRRKSSSFSSSPIGTGAIFSRK